MNLNQRISLFVKLGTHFKQYLENLSNKKKYKLLNKAIDNSIAQNSFFTRESINLSLLVWSKNLSRESINNFVLNYNFKTSQIKKKVAIIMAGNIPLVGFHDFFCVILSGNFAEIKHSSKDSYLLRYILNFLSKEDKNFSNSFHICDKILVDFDAVIATGNNISANQFDIYFKKKPRIIRKNRHSVALLDGNETEKEIELLGKDIFSYYGLGCRNVSKIFIPFNYDLNFLFKSFIYFKEVINKNAYANNYDYYRAIYLLNKDNFYDNGFVLIKESKKIGSPVATIFFEYYKSVEDVFKIINKNSSKIQCLVSNLNYQNNMKFGETQHPGLSDYADNVDTIDFLLKLN